jgi:hypothetical protein
VINICCGHVFGHAELSLIRQVLELLALTFLFFRLKYVSIQVGAELSKKIFSVLGGTLVHFGEGKSRVLPHSEYIVAEVGNPQIAELFILGLRLFGESRNEGATGDASCISHWPTFVFEAVNQCIKQSLDMLSEWFLLFIVDGNFIADLTDAMASGLSDSMVVGQ